MKTQKKSVKNFITSILYIGLCILFSMNATPSLPQAFPDDDFISSSGKDTVLSAPALDAGRKFAESEPGRRSLKRSLRFLTSLVNQPVISRKSMRSGPYDVIIVPGFLYDKEKGAGVILKVRIKWAQYGKGEALPGNFGK